MDGNTTREQTVDQTVDLDITERVALHLREDYRRFTLDRHRDAFQQLQGTALAQIALLLERQTWALQEITETLTNLNRSLEEITNDPGTTR